MYVITPLIFVFFFFVFPVAVPRSESHLIRQPNGRQMARRLCAQAQWRSQVFNGPTEEDQGMRGQLQAVRSVENQVRVGFWVGSTNYVLKGSFGNFGDFEATMSRS